MEAAASHDEHPTGIAVPAVLDHRDVDVDDVAFLQRFVVGNAVADLPLVDRAQIDLG